MEYIPLDATRNEIRLVNILPQTTDGLMTQARHDLPATLRCTVENFSLDEFTAESRAFMKRKGLSLYKGRDFWDHCHEQVLTRQQRERLARCNNDELVVQEIRDTNWPNCQKFAAQPGTNRWSWGDFVALSYTWGSLKPTTQIIVNGTVVQVTQSLETLLRRMSRVVAEDRKFGRKIQILWIDQLCINQNDIEERNIQVKRMGFIYQQASLVVSWLGGESQRSDLAMNLLLQAGLSHQNNGKLNDGRDFIGELRRNAKYFPPGSWKAVEMFFQRPYWTRLWIIQEIALSHGELGVFCGDQFMTWRTLSEGLLILAKDSDLLASLHYQDCCGQGEKMFESTRSSDFIKTLTRAMSLHLAQLHVTDNTDKLGSSLSLADILLAVRHAEQYDIRDKVYGILSLLDTSISKNITPDYNTPVSRVFTEFAIAIIQATGSLQAVFPNIEQAENKKGLILPSWVPDLSLKPKRAPFVRQMQYRTGGSYPAVISLQDTKTLCLEGIILDEIESLGCWCMRPEPTVRHVVHQGPVPQKKSSASGIFRRRIELLKEKARKSKDKDIPILTPSEEIYSKHGLKDAIWRTLLANRDLEGKVPAVNGEAIFNIPMEIDESIDNKLINIGWNLLKLFRTCNGTMRIGGTELKDYFPAGSKSQRFQMTDEMDKVLRATIKMTGRRLIVSKQGYIGLAPISTQAQDLVCVLPGYELPIILRRCEKNYNFVGECYVHGIMDGEVMAWLESGKARLEMLHIV